MFGSKHLITSWDAFHLFIIIEIGVVGFALFCYFFSFFFPFCLLQGNGEEKKNPHIPAARVCPASLLRASQPPLQLPSRGAVTGRNGPPRQSAGTPQLLGNWKVDRGAGAKPSSHAAATGDAGRPEPCAGCSGAGQELLRWGACSLPPALCPGNHGPACGGLPSGQGEISHVSGCLVPSAPARNTGEDVPWGQRQAWLFFCDLDVRGEKPWRCPCLCSCGAGGSGSRVCVCPGCAPALPV